MNDTTRILLVDDDRDDQFLFAKMLVRGGLDHYALRTVGHLDEVPRAFAEFHPAVVVTDLELPDSHGFRTFLEVHRAVSPTPCVVLTGSDDRDLGVRAIQHGAQDLLVKGEFSPATLDRTLRFAQARAVIVQAAASIALHDELTGLPNRALLLDRLDAALRRAARQGERVAVLFIDLDGFKPVNDRHGHAVGDALLREVGVRLRRAVRATDTVARWGGDEFVCVLERVADAPSALRIAAAVHRRLTATPFVPPGSDLSIDLGASLGVALHPDHAHDAEGLLRCADAAMYAAKAAHGGGVLYGTAETRAGTSPGSALRARTPANPDMRPLLTALGERMRD